MVDCKKVILGMGKGGFEASSMLSVRTFGWHMSGCGCQHLKNWPARLFADLLDATSTILNEVEQLKSLLTTLLIGGFQETLVT